MAEDAEFSDEIKAEEEEEDSTEDTIEDEQEKTPRKITLRNPIGVLLNIRMLRRVVQIVFFLGVNVYILAAWAGTEQIVAFWEGFRDLLPTLPIISPLDGSLAV